MNPREKLLAEKAYAAKKFKVLIHVCLRVMTKTINLSRRVYLFFCYLILELTRT